MIDGITIPSVISAAAVDAINPCAIAVLVMLLTTISLIHKKHNILLAGLGFTAAIFLSYFLMGLGLYSAIQATRAMHIFYYFIIALALFVGIMNIKAYIKYKPGLGAIEMPMKWRPVAKKIIGGVTSPIGATAVGFLVSLFLLPCSSGPYIVILGLLAKATTRLSAIPLLLLYNLVFVSPMILLTLLVYAGSTTTTKVQTWRDRNIRKLHLISGILMILLGMFLFLSMMLGWV